MIATFVVGDRVLEAFERRVDIRNRIATLDDGERRVTDVVARQSSVTALCACDERIDGSLGVSGLGGSHEREGHPSILP